MLADSSAALVGTTWGRRFYFIKHERRSVEGSLVFLAVAFLSISGPLLLLSDLDRSTVVLLALQLALLVTCVEAVSTRGIDNLLVPLATFILLLRLAALNALSIAAPLVVQVAVLGVFLLLSRIRRARLAE
jgi:phytol kinase